MTTSNSKTATADESSAPAAQTLTEALHEGQRRDAQRRLERVILAAGLLAFRGDTLSPATAARWIEEFLSKLETTHGNAGAPTSSGAPPAAEGNRV